MARRYLGYGVTNNSGVATLDHAPDGTTLSHSYTGVGAGKIDVVAESGTLQSETYELLDCMYYDGMTTSNHNDSIWWLNNVTMTRGDTYTVIKATAQWGSAYLGTTSTQQTLQTPFCVEFDAEDVSSITNMNIRYNDGTSHYLAFPPQDGHHLVTIESNKQTFKVDGVVKQDWTVDLSNSSVYLQTFASQADEEFKIANFKVYPI